MSQELHLPPTVFGEDSGAHRSSSNAFRHDGYVRRIRSDRERLSR
jgi:hypothetical protein